MNFLARASERLASLRMGARLGLAFGLVLALTAALGAAAIVNLPV